MSHTLTISPLFFVMMLCNILLFFFSKVPVVRYIFQNQTLEQSCNPLQSKVNTEQIRSHLDHLGLIYPLHWPTTRHTKLSLSGKYIALAPTWSHSVVSRAAKMPFIDFSISILPVHYYTDTLFILCALGPNPIHINLHFHYCWPVCLCIIATTTSESCLLFFAKGQTCLHKKVGI